MGFQPSTVPSTLTTFPQTFLVAVFPPRVENNFRIWSNVAWQMMVRALCPGKSTAKRLRKFSKLAKLKLKTRAKVGTDYNYGWFPLIRPKIKPLFLGGGYVRGVG